MGWHSTKKEKESHRNWSDSIWTALYLEITFTKDGDEWEHRRGDDRKGEKPRNSHDNSMSL